MKRQRTFRYGSLRHPSGSGRAEGSFGQRGIFCIRLCSARQGRDVSGPLLASSAVYDMAAKLAVWASESVRYGNNLKLLRAADLLMENPDMKVKEAAYRRYYRGRGSC